MITKLTVAALAAVSAFVILAPQPAMAQSCGSLWYQRNAIYSQAGHCFNTARGRAAFGPGCFPPYGRLSGGQQAQVNAILAQERNFGCPR